MGKTIMFDVTVVYCFFCEVDIFSGLDADSKNSSL